MLTQHDSLGHSWHGAHQPARDSGHAPRAAAASWSRWPAAIARAPTPTRASGRCRARSSAIRRCSTIRRIDAVYIPLPNTDHVKWTLAAIAAGKHVLCEKPLALDPADVDRIAAAAVAAGVVVEEGFMYRHEPLTARVMSLVNDGAIGTVRAVVSGFTFALEPDYNIRLDPALGGGSLWDRRRLSGDLRAAHYRPRADDGVRHGALASVRRRRRVHGHAAVQRRRNRQHLCRVSRRVSHVARDPRQRRRLDGAESVSARARSRRWSSSETARSSTSTSPARRTSSSGRSRISRPASSTAPPPVVSLAESRRTAATWRPCTPPHAPTFADSATEAFAVALRAEADERCILNRWTRRVRRCCGGCSARAPRPPNTPAR